MSNLLCFLGQTNELCYAELAVIARRLELPAPLLITPQLAELIAPRERATELQELLGGTAKIAEILEKAPHTTPEEVEKRIIDFLLEIKPKSFVLAEHGRDHLPPLDNVDIKRTLMTYGVKSNYKESPRYGAGAALLKRGNVEELHVIQTETQLIYATTLTVQDIDTWSLRDAGKPERDRKRGMLQPKIAHMMINLAMDQSSPADHVLLDPFCGTGTIMIEGAFMDIPHVMGADIDVKAILQSNANLKWWQELQEEPFTYEVAAKPVEKLQPQDFGQKPTLIVTEPYLGKMTPDPEQIPRILDGLERMYRGAFRAYGRLLPQGGRVAMLFPSFATKKHSITVGKLFRALPELGFQITAGPFRAGRPDAVTQRELYILEKM
jgi:tRNA G10  N-methylase Trm11